MERLRRLHRDRLREDFDPFDLVLPHMANTRVAKALLRGAPADTGASAPGEDG